jgi:Tfp pilus assembly protein PilX
MTLVLLADELPPKEFLDQHSGELLILVLAAMILVTLLVVVPQLLRSHQRATELVHEERMRALEQGEVMPRIDERSMYAGRTAMLVPMVTVIAAGTVTCFLAAYKYDNLFSVALAVWSVAGVVSLAAITGGVALMGRIAQLHSGIPEYQEEEEEIPEDAVGK